MMSRPPKVSTAAATKRSAKPAVGHAADAGHRLAARGADLGHGLVAPGSASRSLTTTRAPSLASLSAISRPMPRPEPETIATLPSSLPAIVLLHPPTQCGARFSTKARGPSWKSSVCSHAAAGLPRQRPQRRLVQLGGLPGDAEAFPHRDRRIGGDLRARPSAAATTSSGRDHGIDQPECAARVRGDRLAGGDHLQRDGLGQGARQAEHAAGAGDQAALHLRQAEIGRLGRHRQVAGQQQFQPAGQRVALRRGDPQLGTLRPDEAAEAAPRSRAGCCARPRPPSGRPRRRRHAARRR